MSQIEVAKIQNSVGTARVTIERIGDYALLAIEQGSGREAFALTASELKRLIEVSCSVYYGAGPGHGIASVGELSQ